MLREIQIFLVTFCIAIISPGLAVAVPVTFSFTGTLTSVYATVEPYVGDGSISGYYTFESNPSDVFDGGDGLQYRNAILDMSFSVGGGMLSATYSPPVPLPENANRIRVRGDFYQPSISGVYGGLNGPQLSGIVLRDWDISLDAAFPASPLGSDALPLLPPNPLDFDFAQIRVWYEVAPGRISGAFYQVDSLTVTSVPLPSAIWFFGTGLLGLVGIARQKV